MAEKKTKRYLELQMEELKATYGVEEKATAPKKSKDHKDKNAKIAKLYEDAAEYKEDLKCFEEELEIVKVNNLRDIATALSQKFPNEERDYAQELRTIVEMGWVHFVEVDNTHPQEQLKLIEETEFGDIVEMLKILYPDYSGDFEVDIRTLLIKRWETLIAIKKEHIAEELAAIKVLGLKPNYVEKIYKQYHGIE
ncbi:MAG: hypothetical protein K0U47_02965 [Epsilonproteobacteria bacterium]|nr:hypothetical protein [Campylobacterota bacterium]